MRSRARRTRLLIRLGVLVIAVVVAFLSQQSSEGPPAAGNATIVRAFDQRQSDVVVEAGGRIERVLADDEQGSRHQRFIVRLGDGHTVLVSHNIDLAPRVPVAVGEAVAFRGEYEWNERGGVIHWTHHDPNGRRPGGWIEHAGRTYR